MRTLQHCHSSTRQAKSCGQVGRETVKGSEKRARVRERRVHPLVTTFQLKVKLHVIFTKCVSNNAARCLLPAACYASQINLRNVKKITPKAEKDQIKRVKWGKWGGAGSQKDLMLCSRATRVSPLIKKKRKRRWGWGWGRGCAARLGQLKSAIRAGCGLGK